MKVKMTGLEQKLLCHIASFVDKHGYQPTYRQIALDWGYRSPGYIHALVGKLKKRGIVEVEGYRAVSFDYKKYLSTKGQA